MVGVGVWLVLVGMLLLLLRGGSLSRIASIKMISGGRGLEVVLRVDKSSELV